MTSDLMDGGESEGPEECPKSTLTCSMPPKLSREISLVDFVGFVWIGDDPPPPIESSDKDVISEGVFVGTFGDGGDNSGLLLIGEDTGDASGLVDVVGLEFVVTDDNVGVLILTCLVLGEVVVVFVGELPPI